MNLLLDTHVFLWLDLNPGKLSSAAMAACSDPRNKLFLSTASVWEAEVKNDIGRLDLRVPLPDMVRAQQAENELTILPVGLSHIYGLKALEHHHGDPFDRMIISQSIEEGMTVVSVDGQFEKYPIKLLW